MKENVKRWVLILFITFMFTFFQSVMVSAANGSVLLGNVRGQGSKSHHCVHRVFVTGYGRLEITGRTVSNGPIRVRLVSRYPYVPEKDKNDGGYQFYSVNSSKSIFRVYGVMRGPYYIWVDSAEDYYIHAVQYLMSNFGGETKGKAYPLSVSNKWYTGIMPFNENWKNSDWYKFTVPTKRTFYFYFQSLGTGYLEARLFGPGISSAGMLLKMEDNSRYIEDSWKVSWRFRQFPAGTYYLQLKRGKSSWKRTSMGYWVKWK